jgi:hypothetical protein
MSPEEESDQLPEEQPGEAGGSQDTAEASRDDAEGGSGGADEDGDSGSGQATGNPSNAG